MQGMMANRYMATFKDEIMGWNANLNAVADVTQLLIEIQRTWAYLESLFVGSEEVRKELPDAAARFADIDREVKAVLQVSELFHCRWGWQCHGNTLPLVGMGEQMRHTHDSMFSSCGHAPVCE